MSDKKGTILMSNFQRSLLVALASQPAVSIIEMSREPSGESTMAVFVCASILGSIMRFSREGWKGSDYWQVMLLEIRLGRCFCFYLPPLSSLALNIIVGSVVCLSPVRGLA